MARINAVALNAIHPQHHAQRHRDVDRIAASRGLIERVLATWRHLFCVSAVAQ
jgi:hypothetical protein